MKIPEIPITATDLQLGVLWPALVTLAITSAGVLLPMRRREWVAPIAVALGFATAYPMVNGIAARFPPNSAGDWLFWLSVPIAVVAGLIAALCKRPTVRVALGAAVLGALLYLMMQPATASRSTGEWWGLWVLIVLIMVAALWFVDASVADDPSVGSLVGLIGILIGACVLIQMSGSLKWAMMAAAALAGVAAVLILLLFGMHRATLLPGIPLVAVAIVGSLLAVSIEPLFVNVRVANALLIAAAAPLLWAGRFIHMTRSPAWLRIGVRLALPAAPVLAALAMAGAKAVADLNSTGGEYDGY